MILLLVFLDPAALRPIAPYSVYVMFRYGNLFVTIFSSICFVHFIFHATKHSWCAHCALCFVVNVRVCACVSVCVFLAICSGLLFVVFIGCVHTIDLTMFKIFGVFFYHWFRQLVSITFLFASVIQFDTLQEKFQYINDTIYITVLYTNAPIIISIVYNSISHSIILTQLKISFRLKS